MGSADRAVKLSGGCPAPKGEVHKAMICVTIVQTSHHMAYVDFYNAAGMCDLIEIRLDGFERSPDVKELLQACSKPAIVSCRRMSEGGQWNDTDEARLVLLRQAVIEKAAWIELEYDVARQVRRYGETKRLISYTSLRNVPDDLRDIFDEMRLCDPDAIKLTLPARSPEEAWPVIKLVAANEIPVVAVGIGRNNLMLSLLSKRYKAPWIYAALEKGMEPVPGMTSITELKEVYACDAIDSRTPLIAVTGTPEKQRLTCAVLNYGFEKTNNKTRCLPLQMGDVEMFGKIANRIKLAGMLVDDESRREILPLTTEREDAVVATEATDFIAMNKEGKWSAYNTLYRALPLAIEQAWAAKHPDASAIENKTYMVVGATELGRSAAAALRRKGARLVFADPDQEQSQQLANEFGGRFVPATSVYTTMVDGMVLCPHGKKPVLGQAAVPMPKSAAREGMVAVDLTHPPYVTPFLDEVRVLGGVVVRPIDLQLLTLQLVLRAYTGAVVPSEELLAVVDKLEIDYVSVTTP